MKTIKLQTNLKSLTIIGKRWFQRGPGNTYHSAQIMVDGKTVHTVPFAYGYGEGYVQSAFEWLEANGYVELERHANGNHEAPWRYCDRNGITYEASVSDVARKGDL